jgi:hypothetical protein
MASSNWLRYYPKVGLVSISKSLGILSDAQVNVISESTGYLPYSAKGNTYHRVGAKLRNLFSLCQVIPYSVMSFIIKHRVYRIFPERNCRFFISVFIFLHRKIFLRKKNPFAFMSLAETLRYYLYFMGKFHTANLITENE